MAVVASVPLVGPVRTTEPDGWETWAWLGASVVGSVPVMTGARTATGIGALTVAGSPAVGWWSGGSPLAYVLITAGIGLALLAMHGLPVALWSLMLGAWSRWTGRSERDR